MMLLELRVKWKYKSRTKYVAEALANESAKMMSIDIKITVI